MTNAELISMVRSIAKHGADWRINEVLNRAADALEADEKRIEELEGDLRNITISNPERFKIYGYTVKDLLLFADMCKRNDVREADLKQAAWNLELAVRAYHNATIENFRTWEDEKGIHSSARYVPNFEKAYAEMMGKENADADS